MGKKPAIIDAHREIEGTALTATYADVGAVMASDAHLVLMFNTCNDTILVSLDDGTTNHLKLDASESLSLDLKSSQLVLEKGVQIQAKHDGSAPTSGSLRITIIRS
jgi:hypothetical protein